MQISGWYSDNSLRLLSIITSITPYYPIRFDAPSPPKTAIASDPTMREIDVIVEGWEISSAPDLITRGTLRKALSDVISQSIRIAKVKGSDKVKMWCRLVEDNLSKVAGRAIDYKKEFDDDYNFDKYVGRASKAMSCENTPVGATTLSIFELHAFAIA